VDLTAFPPDKHDPLSPSQSELLQPVILDRSRLGVSLDRGLSAVKLDSPIPQNNYIPPLATVDSLAAIILIVAGYLYAR
jgi:hypothetical protein